MISDNISEKTDFNEYDFTGPAKEIKIFIDKRKKKRKGKEVVIESISFGVPGYPCEPNHIVANEETLYINEQCIIFSFPIIATVFDNTFDTPFN